MSGDATATVRSGLEGILARVTLGRDAGHAVGLTHRLLVETWVARAEASHALHFLINTPEIGPHRGQLDGAFDATLALLRRLSGVRVAPEGGIGFRLTEDEVAALVDHASAMRTFATAVAEGALALQSGSGRGAVDAAIGAGIGAFEAAAAAAVDTLARVSSTQKKRNISERAGGPAHAKANHALRWAQSWATLQAVLRVLCMVIERLRGNLGPEMARKARASVSEAIAARAVAIPDVFAVVKPNSAVGRRVIQGVARDVGARRAGGAGPAEGGDLGALLLGGKFDLKGVIAKAQSAVADAATKAGDAAQKATQGAGDLLDRATDSATKLAGAATQLADAGAKLSDSVGAASKNVGGLVKTVETGGLAGGAHALHAAFADTAAHPGTALSGGHVAGMQAIFGALHGGRAEIIESIHSALRGGADAMPALKALTGATGGALSRMSDADLAGGGVVASALVGGALSAARGGAARAPAPLSAGAAAAPASLEGVGTRGFRGVGDVGDAVVAWVLGLADSLDGHLESFRAMLTVGGAFGACGHTTDLVADTARVVAVLCALIYLCRGDKWFWPELRPEAAPGPAQGGGGGAAAADAPADEA